MQVDARGAQLVAAALESLFNGAADADKLCACRLDDLTQTAQRFAAGKEIVDDQNTVAGMDSLF